MINKGVLNVILPCLSYGDENLKKSIKELARSVNTSLWSLIDKSTPEENPATGNKISIDTLIEALSRFMITPTDSQTVTTTIESLKWLLHLVNKQPDLVLNHIEIFFQF